jgi:hypothetical protein
VYVCCALSVEVVRRATAGDRAFVIRVSVYVLWFLLHHSFNKHSGNTARFPSRDTYAGFMLVYRTGDGVVMERAEEVGVAPTVSAS